jgi:hypothetical protein
MNILLLEDRGDVSYYLKQALEDSGHTVFDAFSPRDATPFWENRDTVPIHCIILDLNLPPDGLSDEEKRSSRGGLISGWLWLKNYVLNESPEIISRTIVYSDYLNEVEAVVPAAEYKAIVRIPKKGRSSPAEEVMRHVRRIAAISGSSSALTSADSGET